MIFCCGFCVEHVCGPRVWPSHVCWRLRGGGDGGGGNGEGAFVDKKRYQ